MPFDGPPGPFPAGDQGILGGSDEVAPDIDGAPRRTSPKTLALVALSTGFFFVVLIPQLVFAPSRSSSSSAGDESSTLSLAFALVPVAISVVVATAGWIARTYVVGGDEIVIDEGVFRRRRRVIPYGRVQQVDIDQRFFAQLFRLGTLTIETAGSGGGKARLGLLDVQLARGIRRYVLGRRAEIQAGSTAETAGSTSAPIRPEGTPVPAPLPAAWQGQLRQVPHVPPTRGDHAVAHPSPSWHPPTEQQLLRLGPGWLALAGFTHHFVVSLAPALVLAGVVIGAFAVPGNQDTSPWVVLAVAVAIALLAAVAVAVLVTVQYLVGQYNFTLSEQGDDLHLRYGLFQVRNLTMPRWRVQHITVVDNPLRRALGLVGVQLHSAASATDGQSSLWFLSSLQGRSLGQVRFEIPILDRRDLDVFLRALMGSDWQVPPLTSRSTAARRRAVTRRVGALTLVLVVPALLFPPGSLMLLSLIGLGVPWGLVAHRRAGYAETPNLVVLSRGVLHHRIELLPYAKVQSAFVLQTPFQRFSALHTLHVNVASHSADPRLSDLTEPIALGMVRRVPRRSAPASASTRDAPGYGVPATPA